MTINRRSIGVLHVYDKLSVDGSTIHGGARLLMWTLPRLEQYGYLADLVCLRGEDTAGRYLQEQGVRVHYLGRNKFDFGIVLDLLRHIRQNDIRILHAHGYASSNFARIAAWIANIPIVVHEHFIDPAMPWFQKVADRLTARYMTVGIGVSQAVAGFMKTQRYIPSERLLVLSSGIPLSEFRRRDAAEVADMRRRLGILAGTPVIGVVGRLAIVKGHAVLLRAMPQILESVPEAKLLLLGDGPERNNLEMLTAELGIAANVLFAGHRNDVADVLSVFDVFCMPSYSEGMPIALLEAMATQIPVVASNVGGMRGFLSDGSDSLLVEPGQSDALASAITQVLSSSELAAVLATAGRATVERLDIDPFVRALGTLYESLQRESAKRARRRDWRAFSWQRGWHAVRKQGGAR